MKRKLSKTIFIVLFLLTIITVGVTQKNTFFFPDNAKSLQAIPDTIILTNNTTLCNNATLQINCGPAISYIWSPAAGLSATNIGNPVANPPTSPMTYCVTALATGNNLIRNGNFEQGATSFGSDYQYSPGNGVPEGVYTVAPGSSMRSWHPSFPACGDHTTGGGKYMMVNGSSVNNARVWFEWINVQPHTNYAFSTWIASFGNVNPAALQFSINGVLVGNIFNANSSSCLWKQFYATWNSGTATYVPISIVNKNINASGNDFGLDDISFNDIKTVRDCITITRVSPAVTAPANQQYCKGQQVPAQNLSGTPSGVVYNISGGAAIGLANSTGVTNIPAFTAVNNGTTPLMATITIMPKVGTCTGTAKTFTITVMPNVAPTFTQVAAICSGVTLNPLPTISNNGYRGTWSPALNNLATTTYTFTPSAGQCATTTTMTITVKPKIKPTFTSINPICPGATLAPLPTTSNNGYTGTWSPALNNTATTTYTFTPTAGQCADTATLTITVSSANIPIFTQVGPICPDGTLFTLPTTSNDGYTGSWSPELDNMNTTTYTFTPSAGQCATTTTMTISVNPNVTPSFTQVGAICSGAVLAPLPTTSNDGYTGSWSPELDNMNTTTYTFTPSAGQCATTTTMTISVNPNVTPSFTQVGAICSGAVLAPLPTTSNDGYTGSWSPELDNMNTTTYTFTPSAGQCATTTTMTISVNPNVTPSFTQVGAICSGAVLAPLPTTSNDGYTGSWSPELDNMNTTTYTFTPSAGQCATTTTMTISVNPNVTPSFTQVGAICSGAVLAPLPTTSNDGYTGSWSPELDNMNTTTYTFTPSAGQCATTTTMTISVNPNVTPSFTQVGAICSGAVLAPLPTTSNDGYTGSWSPELDNMNTTTYTFTPSAGQCATTTTMTISVNPNVTPSFTQVGAICSGAVLAPLPTTSNDGYTGSWSPGLDNMNTTTYTFTPSAGQCATTTTMTISVNPIPTIAVPLDKKYCHNEAVAEQNLNGSPSAVVFDISGGAAIGLADQIGVTSIPAFIATNPDTSVVTATINIRPRANNCTGITKSFIITVNPTPVISNTFITGNYCNNVTVPAQPLVGQPGSVAFDITGGTAIGLTDQVNVTSIPAFIAKNSTIAPVTATIVIIPKANDCKGVPKSFDITVKPTPAIIIGLPDRQYCNNEIVDALPVSSTQPDDIFDITGGADIGLPNQTSVTAIPAFTAVNNSNIPITTTIHVMPKNNLCTGTEKTFRITVTPTPIITTAISTRQYCINEKTSAINLKATQSGVVFNITGGTSIGLSDQTDVSSVPSFVTTTVGTAIIAITPRMNGCSGIPKSYSIKINALPPVKASKANDINCSLGSAQLNATGALAYIWSPSTGLNNSNSSNPIAMPQTNTLYTVKGVDENNCINSDTIRVKVSNTTGQSGYLMPNVFSPNNDGKNDCYGVRFWGHVRILEFSIYNRYGERIFYTQRTGDCWDGRYKGILQPVGTYIYMIKADTDCEQGVFKKGSFMLLQ